MRPDFICAVPCAWLADFLSQIDYIPVTREEEGIGLCAGAALAGKFPMMVMQTSGIGNCLNALASLVVPYRLPMLLLISWRGTEGEKVAIQRNMGQVAPELLQLVGVRSSRASDYYFPGRGTLRMDNALELKSLGDIDEFAEWSINTRRPVAAFVRKGVL